MKKDSYYFPHDANAKDDPKCIMMIEQLGLEAYGIYWVLVELLRDQPNYKLPLSMIPALARRYNTTPQKMETVVANYKLFEVENDEFFFSESLIKRMIPLQEKRDRMKSLAEKRWKKPLLIEDNHKRNANAMPTHTDTQCKCNASKVKKSKVEKSKVEDINIEKKDKLSSTDHFDYQGLMDYFNKTFNGKLPGINLMTEKRKRTVKTRVREFGKESIKVMFDNVLRSPFLQGHNDRNWSADFDWIFKPSNYIKILEGNYDERDQKNRQNNQQWKSDAVIAISTTVNEQAKEKRAELKAKGIID